MKKPRLAEAVPPCPKEHGSFLYKRGKIYVNMSTKSFRIYKDTSVVSSDIKRNWAGAKPMLAEWEAALAIIDAHREFFLIIPK